MRVLLEEKGCEVTEAARGSQGYDLFSSKDFDVVLVDRNLPDMDGLEVARRIRRGGKGAEVPVIAVTARALATERQEALEAGCRACMAKPIDPDTFAEGVLELVRGT